MVIPFTQYQAFCREWNRGSWEGFRFGQAFYKYAHLDKSNDPDLLSSNLCAMTDSQAESWIHEHTDWYN